MKNFKNYSQKKKKKNIDGRINELMVEKSNLIEKIKFLES